MIEPPGPGARVILYACTTSNGDADAILTELRQHANAHRWHVVDEFADRTGAAAESSRPGFRDARAALADGNAHGLVTRYPAMAAYLPAERDELAAWLDQLGAFAHYTWTAARSRCTTSGAAS